MKNLVWIFLLSFFIVSCGAKKSVVNKNTNIKKTVNSRDLDSHFSGNNSKNTLKLLKSAEKYFGTPYKYGGNTSDGFDCSGLVCKVFDENNIKIPRRSEDQANLGKEVDIKNVKPGDLVFFATTGGYKVSHVGIVHEIMYLGEVKFIHASTSKGVVISSLNENYWNKAFLFARRLEN